MINYFTAVYTNSNKFNHSLYHFLKIFYERSAKSFKSYSSLGNTFKNSKWTNYKIQNIKTSFTNSFTKILIIVVVLLIVFFNYKQNILLVLELLYHTFYLLIKDMLYDYVNLMLTMLLFFIYSIKNSITNFFIYMLSPNKKTPLITYNLYVPRKSITKLHNIVNSSSFSSHSIKNSINSNYTSVMSSVFKIKNNIYWLNLNIDVTKQNLPSIHFLDSKVVVIIYPKKSNLIYKFVFKKQSHPIRSRILLNENVSTTNRLSYSKKVTNKFINSTIVESILNSTLNIIKQTRWLTRNLMLSDKFILSTNFFTEYKKFIGDNTMLSNLANNNVWASSNMSKISNIQKTLMGLSSQKSSNFHPKHLVDNFDESRLWIFKKMYFNTIIRHGNICIDFFLNKIYGGANIQKNDKIYLDAIKKSLVYNLLFLNNTMTTNSLNKKKNLLNFTNNNFSYNASDYNLLSDDNVDNLINSFIVGNVESDLFIFYPNIQNFESKDDVDFTLSYKKK